MDLREELKSADTYPAGPCSAWPKTRHEAILKAEAKRFKEKASEFPVQEGSPAIKASALQMAQGLVRTAGQAVKNGRVSKEVREERYDTCKACPAFNPDSKRCAECGCFMEAKTWVGGNPNFLCPLKKWSR